MLGPGETGQTMGAEETARMIQQFAEAAACLAEEASKLALASGHGRPSEVSARAAAQAQEAADLLDRMAKDGAPLDEAFTAAAWALSAAAVAVTQARSAVLALAAAPSPP